MIAHGGAAGAVVEALVLVAIGGVFVAVWLRERRGNGDPGPDPGAPARLTDDPDPGEEE